MAVTEHASIGRLQGGFLQLHPDAAHELPEPDENWQWKDVDIEDSLLAQFSARDIIQKENRTWQCWTWTTPRHVHEYIQSQIQIPDITTAECGHTGIHNLGDDRYTCANEDCEETFGRETAREVIQR